MLKSLINPYIHSGESGLTVNVEPGGVADGARPVGHRARVLPAVLDAHAADVDVAHHVAVDRHVLPDQEPETVCCVYGE